MPAYIQYYDREIQRSKPSFFPPLMSIFIRVPYDGCSNYVLYTPLWSRHEQ